jgi:hypothetical protein
LAANLRYKTISAAMRRRAVGYAKSDVPNQK